MHMPSARAYMRITGQRHTQRTPHKANTQQHITPRPTRALSKNAVCPQVGRRTCTAQGSHKCGHALHCTALLALRLAEHGVTGRPVVGGNRSDQPTHHSRRRERYGAVAGDTYTRYLKSIMLPVARKQWGTVYGLHVGLLDAKCEVMGNLWSPVSACDGASRGASSRQGSRGHFAQGSVASCARALGREAMGTSRRGIGHEAQSGFERRLNLACVGKSCRDPHLHLTT